MEGRDEDRPIDLESAFAGRTPDAGTEDEVVALLRAEGLLRGGRHPLRAWGVRAAAAVLLFTGGWISSSVASRISTRAPAGIVTGPAAPTGQAPTARAYMLLMWEGPDYVEEDITGERASEYGRWARSVAAEGIPISGEELAPVRQMLAPTNIAAAADPRRISGYFVVQTDSARAVALAAAHPHRTHGGWVEVAPIVR